MNDPLNMYSNCTHIHLERSSCLAETGGAWRTVRQVRKQELNLLYVQRWHIELDLRAIKVVMGVE